MSLHLIVGASLLVGAVSTLPSWTAPRGNPTKPLGGWSKVPGSSFSRIYNASTALGTYNHAAMVTYGAEQGQTPMFLVTWKNGAMDEDSPGQRVLYSQSVDGVAWTVTDGTNIMFPNMSTNSYPAALFAGPPVWINGHLYAAASPTQFCLYPDQYQPVLLMRRVYTNGSGVLGPVFWATNPAPPEFAEASKLNGVLDISSMDEVTQIDVATLIPDALTVPCTLPGALQNATSKCEACSTGCQRWSEVPSTMANERTHYTLPGSPGGAESTHDVLLYRNKNKTLHASMRTAMGAESWSPVADTGMPNDNSNINAGTLPDGRVYLLSNAMPYFMRDPLTVATSKDGLSWDTCAVAMTCTDLQGDQCGPKFPGKSKDAGPSYPQGVVALDSLFVVATNNKENVWFGRLPLSSL